MQYCCVMMISSRLLIQQQLMYALLHLDLRSQHAVLRLHMNAMRSDCIENQLRPGSANGQGKADNSSRRKRDQVLAGVRAPRSRDIRRVEDSRQAGQVPVSCMPVTSSATSTVVNEPPRTTTSSSLPVPAAAIPRFAMRSGLGSFSLTILAVFLVF